MTLKVTFAELVVSGCCNRIRLQARCYYATLVLDTRPRPPSTMSLPWLCRI